MKIGILYICTGKYTIFWNDFYLSCEKNFISGAEKHYFVFTDSSKIEFEKENNNVHRIFQKNLGWPDNTLKRYEMFLKSKQEIEKMDYLFYFNANLIFLEMITAEEFLPQNNEKLVGCLHPGYYNKPIKKYPFESNPFSKAFINRKEGTHYYAGGINGGETKEFIKAIQTMDKNITDDLNAKIIAKWHDESHWNLYLNNNSKNVKILSPAYLYTEGVDMPFKAKILIKDKRLLGGHSSLRGKIQIRLIIGRIIIYILKALGLRK